MILEASFLQNPKPDKAARIALVERVALGEKEVQVRTMAIIVYCPGINDLYQIWFQNRRQSTRRKQRPLDGDEKAPTMFTNEYSSPYTGQPASDARTQKQQQEGRLSFGAHGGKGKSNGSAQASRVDAATADADENNNDEEKTTTTQEYDALRRVSQFETPNASANPSFSEVLNSQQPPSSQDSDSGRWLSNRRSAAPFRSFHESMSQATESAPQILSQETVVDPIQETTRKGLRKSASSIRLSFGADGTAIVRNGDSPSPPRKLLPPPSTPGDAISGPQLHRTYSSASLIEPGSQESAKSRSLRRVSSFRSHDSRTWEFFCDRDARSELEERAEQEQSGSAADAIKLARSNSGKGLKRSLSNKRTASPYVEVSSAKRVKTAAPAEAAPPSSTPFKEPVQPLMPKSVSSSNPRRILSAQTPGQKQHKTPQIKQTPTFDFPATDSDKENWSPERHFSFMQSMRTSPAVPPTTARRRAPVAHTPLRRGISPTKAGASSALLRQRAETEEEEDDDEEVARFMGAAGGSARRDEGRERQSRASDSVSEEEDLDCVQGLLSLSQGAWR